MKQGGMFMTELEYLSRVRQIREWIERGMPEDLQRAETGLSELRSIYPKRLPYIAAEVALMLVKGEPLAYCRNVIDYVVQEFCPQEGLSDLFALKAGTFPEGSPEQRQLEFLSEFYQTGILPQKAFALLGEMKASFAAGGSLEDLRALADQYYAVRNTLFSSVLMMAYCKQTGRMEEYENYIIQDAGQPYSHPALSGAFGYLVRMFTDGGSYTFLLIEDAGAGADGDMEVLAHALRLLGQNVILLRERNDVQSDQDEKAYALSCVQEARTVQDRIELVVGKCRTASGTPADATPAVVRLLSRSVTQQAPLIVFARDGRMGELHARTALAAGIQRLSPCLPPQFSYGLSVAWTGDYLTYISYLYGESAEELLAAPPSCDFSIVIPVRNAADTLRHTLETCLSVNYGGSYEIVVSDNSDEGCHAVRDLCEELDDPHIAYYRPMTPLSLDKSFEFAFLHARGSFIFAIGADDGVYPWALSCLQQALMDHPNEPLFTWRRGFYTWPQFLPHGRSVLRVPLYEAEGSAPYEQFGMYSHYDDIMSHIDDVFYNLPLLYINSGFRRDYLKTILQKTGRLLDGPAQDAYMAAVSLLLNDHVVHIQCPLCVAGMSGRSIGAGTVLFDTTVMGASLVGLGEKRADEPASTYVLREAEYRVPHIDTADKDPFYMSLARLQEMGDVDADLFRDDYFDYFTKHISVTDIRMERFYGLLLYAASLCGAEQYGKSLASYQNICANPRKDMAPEMEIFSDYKKGYSVKQEELTLDARRFDCQNIVDAVDLSARILNL